MKSRTKAFALAVIHIYTRLPKTVEAQIIGKQVLRSGTSVGAHYREAMRARSTAEFVSKIEGGLQELEETCYWLELLTEANIVSFDCLGQITKDADELMAILITCAKNAKKGLQK